MRFRLSVYSLRWIKNGMRSNKIYARKGEVKTVRRTKKISKRVN